MDQVLFGLLAFGVMLIPLIIIHEFGHLLACKSVGIAVLEFGLGFPPRVAKLFRWGETDFTLNWIPLGGFVMPYGEDFVRPLTEQEIEEAKLTNEAFQGKSLEGAKSVYQAKPWQKAWFLFAGPLANFVAAFVLFGILALTGVLMAVADVTVAGIEADSIADQAGLQEGDIITHVNGQAIDHAENSEVVFDTSPDLHDLVEGTTSVTFTVVRDGETLEIELDPEGVISAATRVGIAAIQEDTPAEAAGFEANDVVLAVNGEPITTVEELSKITSDHDGQEMLVTVLRDNETLEIPVVPERMNGEPRARIGIVLEPTSPVEIEDLGLTVRNADFVQITRHYSILDSFKYGMEQFARAAQLMASIPGRIARGEMTAEEARPVSVVGISQIGGEMIQKNPYQDVVMFTALISIALAITNLLPIPGLDGGRLLFVLIEVIRGKPMTPEREGLVHLIGIGILLSLMVVLVINDLVNPIQY